MSKVHYHFDHVGSYLRPQALKEAHEKFANGEISQEELLKVQDELVKELVHHEVENGLQVVSDGEFGRSWWHLDFLQNLTDFEAYQQEDSYKFHGAKTLTTNVRINGKIAENPNHPFYRDFEYLKSVTPDGITPKVTLPSPSLISIAGIRRDHTEAATITPEAKPRNAFCTPGFNSPRRKNTQALPAVVPIKGISIPVKISICYLMLLHCCPIHRRIYHL